MMCGATTVADGLHALECTHVSCADASRRAAEAAVGVALKMAAEGGGEEPVEDTAAGWAAAAHSEAPVRVANEGAEADRLDGRRMFTFALAHAGHCKGRGEREQVPYYVGTPQEAAERLTLAEDGPEAALVRWPSSRRRRMSRRR